MFGIFSDSCKSSFKSLSMVTNRSVSSGSWERISFQKEKPAIRWKNSTQITYIQYVPMAGGATSAELSALQCGFRGSAMFEQRNEGKSSLLGTSALDRDLTYA